MQPAPEDIAALRLAVSRFGTAGEAQAQAFFQLGAPALDAALGGGLARGGVHELLGEQAVGDAAAVQGFGLGLASRAAAGSGEGRNIVWVRHDALDAETGRAYGAGLAAFGLAAHRVLLVQVAGVIDALRAATEALRCPAVGAVFLELLGAPAALDLTASRRLALAARQSGVTLVLARFGGVVRPGAVATRWAIAARPSVPFEANAPGRPAFAATLLRHRAGLPERTWYLEWNRDRVSFADRPSLSGDLAALPAQRPVAPAGKEAAGLFRRAG